MTADAAGRAERGLPGRGRRVGASPSARHVGLAVLGAFNALAATGGAWGLASGALSLGGLESRLPWESTLLGGLALFVVVAVPNAVLGVLAWHGDRRTGPVAVATGLVLVVWILVELAFLRELSFFHPLYLGVGLLLVWLGRRAPR